MDRKIVTWLWVSLMLVTGSAYSMSSGWLTSPQDAGIRVRLLLSGERDIQNGTIQAALQVSLPEGSKTYWRSPGESGIPATVDWQIGRVGGSQNLTAVDWLWPLPERLDVLGLQTIGYQDEVVFPLFFHINDMTRPVDVRGRLRLPSCTIVCIINDYDLHLSFHPDHLTRDSNAAFIVDKALSRVPGSGVDSGLSVEGAHWDRERDVVVVDVRSTVPWESGIDVIVDGQDDIAFSLPEIYTDESGRLQAHFGVSSWLGEYDLDNKLISVTVVNGSYTTEIELNVTSETTPASATRRSGRHFFLLLGMALLGGLILNLMPCVLPVLAIKLSSVVQSSGQQARMVRRQFLCSAAGIVISFWLLAGFLWALKLAGKSVGWGIQFQNPWFIGGMAIIVALFTANLLSLFEVRLPSGMSTRLAAAGSESIAGHFIQGMFVTLLATPCSAPFVGTAIAFALSGSGVALWTIFTAMGVGLALPYLLIAARPSLLSWLPKPGQWMMSLRRILAFVLMLTMLWLMSLLDDSIDSEWLMVSAFTIVLFFMYQLFRQIQRNRPVFITLVAAVCSSLMIVLMSGWLTGLIERGMADNDMQWESFDEQRLQALVKEGKTVFVDITADWCVTCKANKISTIEREPLNSYLQSEHVVLLQGDWTRPSEKINAFLQKHSRFGVPFNIVYGPGAVGGVPLPVILDADTVVSAIRQARGY